MLKAAVIGLGKIGLMFDINSKQEKPSSHIFAYRLEPEIDLVAAVGVRQEQGDYLQKAAPEVRFYLDMATMLANNKSDIISICTPPTVRLELIRSILEISKPRVIFCEKPVASSIEEAKELHTLLQSYDCLLIPNLSRRWNKGTTKVRQAIKEQQFGKLEKIHLRYTRGIYNTGSHLFDLVRFFAGDIDNVRVIEQVSTSINPDSDPSYSFTFTVGDQITGFAEAFDDRNYILFELDLYFDKGKIEIVRAGDEIRYYSTGIDPLFMGFQSLLLSHKDENLLKDSSNIQNAVKHIADLLENDAEPVCTLEDGIYPLYVAEALIKSYRNNGSVEKVASS
ncbi:gfo/Idh/MocA family oxidoreductase [Paenibacillus psychroresistens]|uniref:Gfo/Idh/MocA family oxidoreductase n=1 Tax=Paenibacillus psychroresistens TaxID=1778678 RepID=A0A6B8RJ56_9BACL|nr:Gfo/Idh/MocA family oxidoreductase [Paenibacillus psychroresistens]QGQ95583.1 gfo/Idh/MocA family oxidoreductase [Paenibacillus psychroresistens]